MTEAGIRAIIEAMVGSRYSIWTIGIQPFPTIILIVSIKAHVAEMMKPIAERVSTSMTITDAVFPT